MVQKGDIFRTLCEVAKDLVELGNGVVHVGGTDRSSLLRRDIDVHAGPDLAEERGSVV